MEVTGLLAAAATIGGVAWILAIARGRVDRAEVARGFTHGAVIATILLAVTATLIAVFLSGREFLGGVVGFGEALGLGVVVGAVLGVAYVVAGAVLMPIGLLVRKSRDWALYGTWAAVVIVIISLGLGWTAYTAYQDDSAPPGPTPAPTR
jgi:hypothetical protein